MKKRFEYKDSNSKKFWEVSVEDNNLHVTFGKIGTTGQFKPKVLLTSEKAIAEMEKLIREKIGKGYVEIVTQDIKNVNSSKTVLYPEIKRLKDLGATKIRVWFQGMGDDGCFSSTVYRDNKVLNITHTLDECDGDIQRIHEINNLFVPCGDCYGDASIMIIDLKTGDCDFFLQSAERDEELIENLLWEGVDELNLDLLIEVTKENNEDDDGASKEISNIELKKVKFKKLNKSDACIKKVKELIEWWLACEENGYSQDGSFLYEELSVFNLKSKKINLNINTNSREMFFSAGEDNLKLNVEMVKNNKIKLEI